MGLYSKSSNIGELILLSDNVRQSSLPVFYSGATYRINVQSIVDLVTRASIGLGNVDNTSDVDKPVSAAQLEALNAKANVNHSHSISSISGLGAELANRATINHTHPIAEVAGLDSVLSGKSAIGHQHQLSDVTGLNSALSGKVDNSTFTVGLSTKTDIGHTHSAAEISGLPVIPSDLASQTYVTAAIAAAPVPAHNHVISQITGLSAELSSKVSATQLTQEISTVNVQLASKANTATVNAQLATKAETSHAHTYAEVGDLSSELDDIYLSLDNKSGLEHTHQISQVQNLEDTLAMKAGLDHTHSTSDINNLNPQIRTVIQDVLIAGNNITFEDVDGRIAIIGSGGTTAPVQAEYWADIYHTHCERGLAPSAVIDAALVVNKKIIGISVSDHQSDEGHGFFINQPGLYRITVQSSCTIAEVIKNNNVFQPTVIPTLPIPVRQGHHANVFSDLTMLGMGLNLEQKLISLNDLPEHLGAFDSVFYIEVTQAQAENAYIVIKPFFQYDVSDEAAQDVSNININEWKAEFASTIYIEQIQLVNVNAAKPANPFTLFIGYSDTMLTGANDVHTTWYNEQKIDSSAKSTNFVGYTEETGKFTLSESGVYKVTMSVATVATGEFAIGSFPPSDEDALACTVLTYDPFDGPVIPIGPTEYKEYAFPSRQMSSSGIFGSVTHVYYFTASGPERSFKLGSSYICPYFTADGILVEFNLKAMIEKIAEYEEPK